MSADVFAELNPPSERVCMWAFDMMGAQPDDEFVDFFPGSGSVTRAWEKWRMQLDFVGARVSPLADTGSE